jgi:hypothetical protein
MKHHGGKARKDLIFLAFYLLLLLPAHGQVKTGKNKDTDLPPPRDVRLLDEHKDGNGNTLRTIQYLQNGSRITETIIIPATAKIGIHVPVDPDTMNKDSVLVIVNKSHYSLEVYYRRKIIRSYKAVFGPKPLENKTMAGDRCTPEGWFKIQNKNPNSKYDKFMLLNYPNDSSIARFNMLKMKGAVPASAGIGGDIGIHGIWRGGDDLIEKGVCWTDGCVALKNKDIEDLYALVSVGTRVYIRK